MLIVYRVQNADGRGPYNIAHQYKSALNLDHKTSGRHPPYCNDEIPYCNYGRAIDGNGIWVCGFKSEYAMKCWFGEWLLLLESVGFSVVTFQVSDEFVCNGIHQLTFDITKATIVPQMELAEAA